jgi:hypothetical protein
MDISRFNLAEGLKKAGTFGVIIIIITLLRLLKGFILLLILRLNRNSSHFSPSSPRLIFF